MLKESEHVLELNDFSFRYSQKEEYVLQNINMKVQKGECVVLAGESGCGKSTLLRCLNGIIPHLLEGEVKGSISILGNEFREISLQELSTLTGSVFQNPRSQFFHIDVTDEIAFGPESMGLSQNELIRRVDDAFDLFAINHLRGKKMYGLSSGEQQKVSFAAIYAAGAEIYLLDEPSANLDIAAIQNLHHIVRLLKKKGKTIIIAEHRLHYLADVLDKIVVLKNGCIEEMFFHETIPDNATVQRWGLRSLDLIDFINKSSKFVVGDGEGIYDEERIKPVNVSMENISFSYPRSKEKVLKKLFAELFQGEKVAIIGQNGSGKTTFSKLLSGLLKPTSGAVYDSNNGKMKESHRLETCGLVLQESSHQLFFPTVLEELASAREEDSTVDPIELLHDLGLEGQCDDHPQCLSAGQQQRLVFAIATVNNPRILILDEPTSGLDARSMQAVGERILSASREGSTVVIVTHDFELVSSYCDAALLLKDGQVIERIERVDFGEKLLSSVHI